jgi:thiamine-monophosphate kinase
MTAGEIGWRAASAALSDLAAVAADPQGVLSSVALPASLPPAYLEDLMAGVDAAARAVGAQVWGGDLTQGEHIVVDVTVVGHAPHPVRRSGARPGDGVWVTGRFGGAAAALAAWESGATPTAAARERFAHPEPRVAWARWLAGQGATALIDVSDGLAGDGGHVAAASGVALALDADRVPCHPDASSDQALSGGEDYELLVTLSGSWDAPPPWLTRIGEVVSGVGVRWTRDGLPFEPARGYSHF